MERHISSPREVRKGCDDEEGRRRGREKEGVYLWGISGEGMQMVVTGGGTIWRGKREDRGS